MTNQQSGQIEYRVNVHHEDGSYWAEVDQLPGCFAAGDTMEELWESLAESIGAYLSDAEHPVHVQVDDKEIVSESQSVDARVLVS